MTHHRPAIFFLILSLALLLAACQPAAARLAPTAAPLTQPASPTPPAVAFLLTSPTPDSPALTPTADSPFGPTPTLAQNLLHRVPDEITPSPPEGIALNIYKMTGAPFPDEGYDPFFRALGDQSRVSHLPQGRTSWDIADLVLLEADNAALAPFGYHLVSKPVDDVTSRWFVLYQGDKIILDPITQLTQVSVNRSGTDFLLLVGTTTDYQLVRKGSLAPWKFLNGRLADSRPQYLGDDILHVENQEENPAASSQTPEPPARHARVLRGDQVIYQTAYQDRPAASGYIGFWTYGTHWALETVDHVIIDGQDLNKQNGYDKSYEFHILSGKPLFFFEKAGALNVSYNGKTAPLPFPAIPHYGCCSAGVMNPLQIGDLLLFYGMQGEHWFYIELAEKDYAGP